MLLLNLPRTLLNDAVEQKLPTQLNPQDRDLFLESLKAQSVPELVRTARLWEDWLLERHRIPFFLARVGDVRASLKSTATALILYKEVGNVSCVVVRKWH